MFILHILFDIHITTYVEHDKLTTYVLPIVYNYYIIIIVISILNYLIIRLYNHFLFIYSFLVNIHCKVPKRFRVQTR